MELKIWRRSLLTLLVFGFTSTTYPWITKLRKTQKWWQMHFSAPTSRWRKREWSRGYGHRSFVSKLKSTYHNRCSTCLPYRLKTHKP
ncbi:hypothetical protein LINGRAHAP2_LOCUS14592 [Linum grandiflorum]